MTLGEQLKEQGAAKVLQNNTAYKWMFWTEARWLLSMNTVVTSEDVTERMLEQPTHPNAIGACMRSFAKQNGLKVISYRKSTKPSRHAGLVAVWGRSK